LAKIDRQIKTVRQLIRNLDTEEMRDFYVVFNHNAMSWKSIMYDADSKLFLITNEIDESEQNLTAEELMDESITFIGKAMETGAFYRAINKKELTLWDWICT
jgi:hypothetical protein